MCYGVCDGGGVKPAQVERVLSGLTGNNLSCSPTLKELQVIKFSYTHMKLFWIYLSPAYT